MLILFCGMQLIKYQLVTGCKLITLCLLECSHLAFENPPYVFGSIRKFVYEIPASVKERAGHLHLGCCLA
jgi:hypothetical protein